MERRRQQLRLAHLLAVTAAVGTGFAAMPPWGATLFAAGCLCGCLAVGLGLAPITDLLVMMACLFIFDSCVSNAVERAKPPPNRALQRTRPSATGVVISSVGSGGPVH